MVQGAVKGRTKTKFCGFDLLRKSRNIKSHFPRAWRLWKIRPSEITFSQDSIGKKFTDGNSLDDTLEKLLSGDCKVEEIEKIKITWHAHPEKSPGIARWWTYTGNRRLSLYQTLEEQGHLQYIVAEWVNVPVPEWRMTTERPGDRPFVRR